METKSLSWGVLGILLAAVVFPGEFFTFVVFTLGVVCTLAVEAVFLYL